MTPGELGYRCGGCGAVCPAGVPCRGCAHDLRAWVEPTRAARAVRAELAAAGLPVPTELVTACVPPPRTAPDWTVPEAWYPPGPTHRDDPAEPAAGDSATRECPAAECLAAEPDDADSGEELTAAEASIPLGSTEDAVLARERSGELPARLRHRELAPTAESDVDEPDQDDEDARDGGEELDPRAGELAELLGAGCPVTGPQAAALHACSPRTGRRLLRQARTHLAMSPPRPAAGEEPGTARRLDLYVVAAEEHTP